MNAENQRLDESNRKQKTWKKWGPYLTERQWGTVREDYSANGDAWSYTTHDTARSTAYRWGEEGIGGISDDQQLLCFAVALWNGQDQFLKERLFGLAGPEGNHGEDVKELYYYLDNTPTHSYMKMLYKYPQSAFPYQHLIDENKRRNRDQREFELIDAGVFDQNKYFDVFIEYAKSDTDDILIKITAHNRGDHEAVLDMLPTLWFRNTWSWNPEQKKPNMVQKDGRLHITDAALGDYYLYHENGHALFCENESNAARLYKSPKKGFCKDGINDYVVNGDTTAVNPSQKGTKAAVHYHSLVQPNEPFIIKLRLANVNLESPFENFDHLFKQRQTEADSFYQELQRDMHDEDERRIHRQALAGMLWTKQFYYYDIPQWLKGDPDQPPPPKERLKGRNAGWMHLNNADIISMPDTWEYPWYAAWDLAFHCIALALVDIQFAKEQLYLFTREWYMHPNGQLPAYEWAFGDVNPPVHAAATLRVYFMDKAQNDGVGDTDFLERMFMKLMLNFTWWVNRKDHGDNNIFQGGFLGLDNIGVFNRSEYLPTGGHLEQSDGTSWMAMYCLNMMRMALELALERPIYEDMATKFFEHFMLIAGAMTNISDEGIDLWDAEDEFYYDVLHTEQGETIPLKIRSIVGLIPLFAVETLEPELLDRLPNFKRRLEWFLNYRKDLAQLISRWFDTGAGERHFLSLLRGHRMKRLLYRMLDETEFLSTYGVRALSKIHQDQPYTFYADDEAYTVAYEPGESSSPMFGGNSNWRGPIWFPMNFLLIESLHKFHHYYGDDFIVEYPTGSKQFFTIEQIADKLSQRLIRLFKKDKAGRRPIYGDTAKFKDPHFCDHILFYEYFHGDDGRGLGASHQTGWTGLIANLLQPMDHVWK